jgi:hypothetical protein
MWINFAHDERLVATAANRFANQALGAAFSVHLSGIDQSGAKIQREPKGGDFLRLCPSIIAHPPRADP